MDASSHDDLRSEPPKDEAADDHMMFPTPMLAEMPIIHTQNRQVLDRYMPGTESDAEPTPLLAAESRRFGRQKPGVRRQYLRSVPTNKPGCVPNLDIRRSVKVICRYDIEVQHASLTRRSIEIPTDHLQRSTAT
jgi:hypothetical protein